MFSQLGCPHPNLPPRGEGVATLRCHCNWQEIATRRLRLMATTAVKKPLPPVGEGWDGGILAAMYSHKKQQKPLPPVGEGWDGGIQTAMYSRKINTSPLSPCGKAVPL